MMATWQEKFAVLSAENGRQVERWEAGEKNHAQLRASCDAITFFMTQYEAAGQPERDEEMPY